MASVAGEFRRRFSAATLFLEGCADIEARVRKSGELTATLCQIMKDGKALTKAERDGLSEQVMGSSRAWSCSDATLLLRALDESLRKKRRSAQNWADALLGVFTEVEWTRWKAMGLDGIESTLTELIQRMKLLGAKNLCEHTIKKLTAIWLHLRGDGVQLDFGKRSHAQELLKRRLQKCLKKAEPAVYLEKLDLADLLANHPHIFTTAYGMEEPKEVPGEDKRSILYLDSMMSCRGGSDAVQLLAAQPQPQPQPQPLAVQPLAVQHMDPMQAMQALFSQLMGMQQPRPNVHIIGEQPRGRPMRALREAPAPPAPYPPAAGGPLPIEDRPRDLEAIRGNDNDDIDEVARKMLNRGKKTEESSEEEEDSDDEDEEEEEEDPEDEEESDDEDEEEASDEDEDSDATTSGSEAPLKLAPKKKAAKAPKVKAATAPKVKAPKVKAAKAAKVGAVAEGAAWPEPPSIGWERSRLQIMCRTGKGGRGSSHAIPFEGNGGEKGALKKATEWLRDMSDMF